MSSVPLRVRGAVCYKVKDNGDIAVPRHTVYKERRRNRSRETSPAVNVDVDDPLERFWESGHEEDEDRPRGEEGICRGSSSELSELEEDHEVEKESEEHRTLNNLQKGFLLLDILRWLKFKRSKTELLFDLKTTAVHMSTLSSSSPVPYCPYPTSIYQLKKMVPNTRDISIYYICPDDLRFLGGQPVHQSTKGLSFTCGNGEDSHEVPVKDLQQSCFLYVSLKDGLRRMFQLYGAEIVEMLKSRAEKKEGPVGVINDVFDGLFYKTARFEPHDVTIQISSDGAERDSSGQKVYAVHWTVMELRSRTRLKAISLSTLWIGKNDQFPHRKIVYKLLIDELRELGNVGMKWTHNGVEYLSHIFPTTVVADAMERFALAGLSTFNSKFGCTFCVHQTIYSGRMVYLPVQPPATLRTDHQTANLAKQLMSIDDPTFREEIRQDASFLGVSETSVFEGVRKLPRIFGLPVDFMHLYLKGVVPKVFASMNLNDEQIRKVDSRTSVLNIGSAVSRKPRTFKEFGLFKANECRDVLFYGSYALHGVLSVKDHYLWSLVLAVGIVATKDTISHPDRAFLDKMCPVLVDKLHSRFGDAMMTYNIHQILHIPQCVRLFGNMALYSAFPYEDKIGQVMKNIHGYNHSCREVGRSLLLEDVVVQLLHEIDLATLPKDLKLLLRDTTRGSCLRRAKELSGFVLIDSLAMGELQRIKKKDYATWKLVYDFLEQRGDLGWQAMTSATLHYGIMWNGFRVSGKKTAADDYADSLFYTTEGEIYSLQKVVMFAADTVTEEVLKSPLLISRKATLFPNRPYNFNSEIDVSTLKVVQWSSTIEIIFLHRFAGQAFELPYDKQLKLISLLPRLLYQMD